MGPGKLLTDNNSRALRWFTIIYSVIGIGELLAQLFQGQYAVLSYVFKPLILISLFFFYLDRTRLGRSYIHHFMLAAMGASLIGDILLLFSGKIFFILGLCSFLIAHIFYIISFSYSKMPSAKSSLLRKNRWIALPFLLYAILIFSLIYPGLDSLVLPVLIYVSIILVMSLTALNRWNRVPEKSFSYVFFGSLLFLISDSILAITNFASDIMIIPFASFVVMLTYILAQYLIVIGMLYQHWHPKPQIGQMN